MACTSTKIALECKIPHELDALKWKAIGRRRGKKKKMFAPNWYEVTEGWRSYIMFFISQNIITIIG
jgi:hypothetical protein